MIKWLKKFFGIEESFRFEWNDLSALLTVANVALIMCSVWWAPILGLTNCALTIAMNCEKNAHINFYFTQIALVLLNIYFLQM